MKRVGSLILLLAMLLSLGTVSAFASSGEPVETFFPEQKAAETELDGLTVTAPAAYTQGTGVINGYYAAIAPIVLNETEGEDTAALVNMGYVVVDAHGKDLADAAGTIKSGNIPGDPDKIIVRGSTAAAQLAAGGSFVYAAMLNDPIVDAKADPEAVQAELDESMEDLAQTVATVSITEASNSHTVADEAKTDFEAAYGASAEIAWSEASAEPRVADIAVTTTPKDWGVPADAPSVKTGKGAAEYVRIHWDLKNETGSYAAAYGLAESFMKAGSAVQFAYVWDNTVSDTEAFGAWVDRICKFEADFTTDEIETVLDLSNALATGDAKWTLKGACYVLSSDRYIGVVDVAKPELPEYQGVSVAVPAQYVKGINADGTLDIDWDAEITNSNGMTYTAATAPIVMQTGATGYSVKLNYTASTGSTGFITVEPGNRGKYSQAYDAEGHVYYTGDAPCCTTDQKSTVRWLRYNHALGLIPGDIDRIVTWGGSGGGAHSTLICGGDSPYYAEYLYKNGALGVDFSKGEYVYLDGFSDAVWGSCPGGAVTNLEEANMLYEFETWLSTPTDEVLLTLDDGTPVYVPTNLAKYSPFYKLLSYYMVMEFVDYFAAEGLSYDVNGDGKAEALELFYDPAGHPETSGLYGSYVDFFLDSAEAQLEWYLNNIDAATNNTYFGDDKVEDFLTGNYTYVAQGGGPDVPSGEQPGIDLYDRLVASVEKTANGYEVEFKSVGAWEDYRGRSKTPLAFDAMNYCTENEEFGDAASDYRHWDKYCLAAMTKHYDELEAAYTDGETKYDSFAALYEDFANDCIEIVLGQEASGKVTKKNIEAVLATCNYNEKPVVTHDAVWMYNPMNLFLDGSSTLPAWVWTVTGAADSDSSNLVTLNDAVALAMNGVDAEFAWTWGAGHGANTPLNTTQNGTIDAMMAKYAE